MIIGSQLSQRCSPLGILLLLLSVAGHTNVMAGILAALLDLTDQVSALVWCIQELEVG